MEAVASPRPVAAPPLPQRAPREHVPMKLTQRLTSPRLRGEVGSRACAIRVRGPLRESEPVERPPHPDPLHSPSQTGVNALMASGEREQCTAKILLHRNVLSPVQVLAPMRSHPSLFGRIHPEPVTLTRRPRPSGAPRPEVRTPAYLAVFGAVFFTSALPSTARWRAQRRRKDRPTVARRDRAR
jgi:hypothetical protein